jgi:pimeloyl-ACP methyl ester carboxylesterase
VVGKGPNLVRAGSWFTHLEYDWDNHPAMSGLMRDLARDFRLLRYDPRGSGMSDWEVDEISLDAWVRDLETVVDLAQYDRFALYGGSQGGAVSIAYTARHPDRGSWSSSSAIRLSPSQIRAGGFPAPGSSRE